MEELGGDFAEFGKQRITDHDFPPLYVGGKQGLELWYGHKYGT